RPKGAQPRDRLRASARRVAIAGHSPPLTIAGAPGQAKNAACLIEVVRLGVRCGPNSEELSLGISLPVYPRKRTPMHPLLMSQKGPKGDIAPVTARHCCSR